MKIATISSQLDIAFKGRVVLPTDCITIEKEKLFYIDDNELSGKCIVLKKLNLVEDAEQKYMKVFNENENNVAIWAVDGCFLSSSQIERCDCIFFDEYDFCFVEFKVNATSLHPKFVRKNREKAISQLKSMIELIKTKFSEKSYTFLGYNLEAYICAPASYPNKNTSISDFAIEFLEEFGVKLYEQNYKKCK